MKQRVIALGLFDGVHLGHGALLSRAKQRAEELGVTSAALTFSTPPVQVVTGEKVALINTPSERTQLMQKLYNIEEVLMLPFDATFAARTWDEFLTFLSETYHACHIVAGFDFRFGAGGMGDAARLRTFCASHSIGCDIVDPVTIDDIKVSSTHIRTLIQNGDMEEAARFLGHPHFMMQEVSEGHHLGRMLDAPTVNHTPDPAVVLPPFGVYATRVYIDDSPIQGATNIGVRPSVSEENKITVETHLLDFTGDLYGKKLPLEFITKIRDERKFPSKDALSAQIRLDIETIRQKK